MKGTVNKVQINFNKTYFLMKTKLTNREQVPFLRSILISPLWKKFESAHTDERENRICRGH